MPFEIRIQEWGKPGNNMVDLGQFQDAVTSYTTEAAAEVNNFILCDTGKETRTYRVIKTLIHSDAGHNDCYMQSLQDVPKDPYQLEFYLKAVMTKDEKHKKVTLYVTEKDQNPLSLNLPILPRTTNDYIRVGQTCYRCDKVLFAKNEIMVISNYAVEYSSFEADFFVRLNHW